MKLIDSFPYKILVPLALWMAIAPVTETSHLIEKLGMLAGGSLKKPIDIFDLLLHSTPIVFLIIKLVRR